MKSGMNILRMSITSSKKYGEDIMILTGTSTKVSHIMIYLMQWSMNGF